MFPPPPQNACPLFTGHPGQDKQIPSEQPAPSPAAALPFPPWSASLPSSHPRFPSPQRTPNPNPLPPGVGGAGSCPRSSGTASRERGIGARCLELGALGRARGKTGSSRPSGPAGTGPHRALPQSWMSPEGRDVPGDTWQVLVPVSWGFIALAELESHPVGWILSIPWDSTGQISCSREDGRKPHPKLAPEATPPIPPAPTGYFQPRVTQEGHPCQDPAPRNCQCSGEQGTKWGNSSG